MPPKELKPFEFEFTYNGKTYYFKNYYILEDSEPICRCDLTATNYYGNKEITLICCKIALNAYLHGKIDGKIDAKQEIRKALGL